MQEFKDDKQEGCRVATVLPQNSIACPFMRNHPNRADFARTLIEDFYKANGNPGEYTKLPEKERLEKFFGVKPAHSETGQRLMRDIARMEGGTEKKRLAYEVGYILICQWARDIFTGDLPAACFFVHFVVSSAKELVKDGVPANGLEYACIRDLKKFGNQYDKNRGNAEWLAKIEKAQQSIEEAERLFVQLVCQWFSLSDAFPETKRLSAGQVADHVLEFMKMHAASGCMDDMLTMPAFTVFMKEKFQKTSSSAS